MDQEFQFENLFPQNEFYENDSLYQNRPTFQQSFSNAKLLNYQIDIEKIDEEMFQISPVLISKNVDFVFEEFEKLQKNQIPVRKNSIMSFDKPMLVNDFKVF